MENEKPKPGRTERPPAGESGHRVDLRRGPPAPVIMSFEQGKTLCPKCGAKLSRDLDRERQERILAEEAAANPESGTPPADRSRVIGPFYWCGRCGERFLGAGAGSARTEKGSLFSQPR